MDIPKVNAGAGRIHVSDVGRKDERSDRKVSGSVASRMRQLDYVQSDSRPKDVQVLPALETSRSDKSVTHRTDDLRAILSSKRKADDEDRQVRDEERRFVRDDSRYDKRVRSDRDYEDARHQFESRRGTYPTAAHARNAVRGDDYARHQFELRAEPYSSASRLREESWRDDHRERDRGYEADRLVDPRAVPRFDQASRSMSAAGGAPEPARDYDALIKNPDTIKADHAITIQNRRDAPYMVYLRKGEKTAECRVNGQMYRGLREGQIILFHNSVEGIFCKIVFLHVYKTFKEMVEAEGATNLLPQLKKERLLDADLVQQAVKIYEGFPGSHNVTKWGSIAIGVTYLCDKPEKR